MTHSSIFRVLWLGTSLLTATLACNNADSVFGRAENLPEVVDNNEGGSGGEAPRPDAIADKVDLLFVVDNTGSMVDKQEILNLAIPALLNALTNPPCVDADGRTTEQPPAGSDEACPAGTARQFVPVTDLHIGVISSSIGSHGADTCSNVAGQNDRARLLRRIPGNPEAEVNTYLGLGFLAWDPLAALDPPGTADLATYSTNLQGIVLGAGQEGCGFEAPLEAFYRFLIDPDPYDRIELDEQLRAQLVGTDEILLAQRRDFLRPDSLLTVVLISDENDCSIIDGGRFYLVGQTFEPGTDSVLWRMPRARAACAADPNDPCCRSCGESAGDGCDTSADNCSLPFDPDEDGLGVRCWQQKRRFGIDALHPTSRYVEGLTAVEIPDRQGDLQPNPLFSNLRGDAESGEVRDERLILFNAIVGVPWQDIARRDQDGVPDLGEGRNGASVAIGGFQSPEELEANGTWDLILGEPDFYVTDPGARPDDPLMLESIEPRTGVNPVLLEPLAPPGAPTNANSINGHEYTANGDLQYACVFPLLVPRDCTSATNASRCDCRDPNNDNPLCQNADNEFTTTQFRAKAYPGLRHLEVARGLGDRGILGSICPVQINRPTQRDFGYEPQFRTLVERIAPLLR